MAITGLAGSKRIFVGPTPAGAGAPAVTNVTLDAANEAIILFGRIETSDEGSHTLDTTGSSSIKWRTGSVTFANAGTTVKVGVAPLDTAAGPAARAVNSTDVITFDVSADFVGGGGGIAANSYQTSVPTTGTKTIAHGDLVAVCIQMTARGGSDVVNITNFTTDSTRHRPGVTTFLGGVYAAAATTPNVFITFSDGATGWIYGGEVFTSLTTRAWNSSSANAEYGQLYNFPFPVKVYGAYGWLAPTNDCDVVLYSDVLGTPVAEQTVSLDANVAQTSIGRRFEELFPAPEEFAANNSFGIVIKPGGADVSTYLKTHAATAQRISNPWGTSGYGIARVSGVFAAENSELDQYYLGAIIGGFDNGAGGGGGGIAHIVGG